MRRFFTIWSVSALLLSHLALAQVTAAPSRSMALACVERMPIPGYRGVLWMAQVSGQAQVRIVIGEDGKVSSIEVQSSQPILADWLKASLRNLSMYDNCAGSVVEINFIYRLLGDRSETPRDEILLKESNTFDIIAHPPIIHTIAD
jgi:hypothetical protein